VFPLIGVFAQLAALAPQVRLLNMGSTDFLRLLVKSPCNSLIDVDSSVFIATDTQARHFVPMR